jgi:membrane protein implicated in regulation of membrane protease activity
VYGVAWILGAGALVVGGLVIALALTAWAPLLAFIALAVVAFAAPAYFASKRMRIGTERERAASGETAAEVANARRGAAPAAGEGSAPGSDDREGYEPAL